MKITRRNFVKGFILGLVGSSVPGGLENISSNLNPNQEELRSTYYSAPVRSINPCGEIALLGNNREEAEEFASHNWGIVNYSGIVNGRKVEGSYKVDVITRGVV